MEQLAKEAAELALRLAALSPDAVRNDTPALDAIEQVALRILKEVSAVRVNNRPVGETCGRWRPMQPVQRHQ
jgi:hypothetical protein